MPDPNQPVENAELIARLVRSRDKPEDDVQALATLQMIRDATYLIATQVAHPDGQPAIVEGVMRAGTRINLYVVSLPGDRRALAGFTDWTALRAAVGEGSEWSGLIQPGEDLLRMGMSEDYPGGVVINPSGPDVTLEMTPERLRWLFANTRVRADPAD